MRILTTVLFCSVVFISQYVQAKEVAPGVTCNCGPPVGGENFKTRDSYVSGDIGSSVCPVSPVKVSAKAYPSSGYVLEPIYLNSEHSMSVRNTDNSPRAYTFLTTLEIRRWQYTARCVCVVAPGKCFSFIKRNDDALGYFFYPGEYFVDAKTVVLGLVADDRAMVHVIERGR